MTTYYHKSQVRRYMASNIRVLDTANSTEQRPCQEANSSVGTRSEPRITETQVRILLL
jgi:hypothetical protein